MCNKVKNFKLLLKSRNGYFKTYLSSSVQTDSFVFEHDALKKARVGSSFKWFKVFCHYNNSTFQIVSKLYKPMEYFGTSIISKAETYICSTNTQWLYKYKVSSISRGMIQSGFKDTIYLRDGCCPCTETNFQTNI